MRGWGSKLIKCHTATFFPYVLITPAGLTYFLTAVERDGGEAFVDTYLRKHPECTHLVQPLSWDKQKRNRDVVRNKYIGGMCDGDGGVCVCHMVCEIWVGVFQMSGTVTPRTNYVENERSSGQHYDISYLNLHVVPIVKLYFIYF